MSLDYRYTVDEEMLKIFTSVSKRQREELFHIFDQLGADPFVDGDCVQHDTAGRSCQVKRFKAWPVTWWPEHWVKELHILDVERLR